MRIVQQLRFLKVEIVEEITRADAGKGKGGGRISEMFEQFGIGQHGGDRSLPQGPLARGVEPGGFVIAGQPIMIGFHQIAALILGDEAGEAVPLLRHDLTRALGVQPVLFGLAGEEHAAQHQFGHTLRMRLGIGERECSAPAAAEHLPCFMPAHFAQFFEVSHDAPGVVVFDLGEGQ